MRQNRKSTTVLLLLILLMGLSLLLYPLVSDLWNRRHQTHAILDYDRAMQALEPADYGALFAAAEEYNRALGELDFPFTEHERVAGYGEALNVLGNGIMGYISIPAIQRSLAIYHGTSDGVLSRAVGHLEGSSLPVGGAGTHSVLSGHSGLPSASLFTELELLKPGDSFVLTVLDRELHYEVDQILVVEPEEVEALYVKPGEDLCTLVTCTPYGVNSHRLLVRGHRVEPGGDNRVIPYTGDHAPLGALGAILFLCAVGFGMLHGCNRRGEEEI